MTTMSAGPRPLLEEFETHRPFLFGLAYRMTGSASDAEDIVQDAWLRAERAREERPKSARSYLATIVSRLAIDHLRSARVRREQYTGQWLPEPLTPGTVPAGVDPAAINDAKETLSYAFMVLLERLGPVERAVFVLHEAFDFRHGEIAEALGISDAASRQHLRRARHHLAGGRQRHASDPGTRADSTRRFVEALGSGDISRITSLLASDAVMVSDGGGRAPAALNPVYGANPIARFFIGVLAKEPPEALEFVTVNGAPAVLTRHGRQRTLVTADIDADGTIHAVYVLRNPEKLGAAGTGPAT